MHRSTVVMLVLFALLGSLVWFMQQPGNPIKKALATSTTVPSISTDTLISPSSGPVSRISIQAYSGKTVTIDKTSGQWIVDEGKTGPADQNLAESTAGQALKLRIVTKLDNPPDPAGTGLDKPAYTVSFTLSDGSMTTIKIGKVSVTNSGYYVEAANGNVYILSKSEIDSLTSFFLSPPVLQSATSATPDGNPAMAP